MKIDRFIGRYRIYSNFWITPIVLDNVIYDSVEHAYQASKTLDEAERQLIHDAPTPGEAKRLGRSKDKGGVVTLRPHWEAIKIGIMHDLVLQKFSAEPMRTTLMYTGDAELIEGNSWHDEFWGVCSCPRHGKGLNMLGKILMQVRHEIK